MTEAQRTIPQPGFADDTGEADPIVLSALAAFEVGQAEAAAVEGILATSRLIVPVVPAPVEGEESAARSGGERQTDMAMVTVTGRDGRRGMPVFTSLAALQRWNPEARPVPVQARSAARAAVDDGADALLVDPSPRPRFIVAGERLVAMANGWRA